jgi:biopolymer transport protein ExbB
MRNKKFAIFVLISAIVLSLAACVYAAGIREYIPDTQATETGMTLWQTIKAGGSLMFVLAFLSMAAVALVVYYFMEFKEDKLIPSEFLHKVMSMVEAGKYNEAKVMCETYKNFVSEIALAGISRKGHDKSVVVEAVEDKGKRMVTGLWQKLSYLADIAVISPLVGLLGTVVGMIQAFNVIAFQTGGVKPMLLANGIAKAMITTAAGLIIAIPAMAFYSYFKGVVQNIVFRMENIATDIVDLIASGKK